jgi:hypothetical protein
LLSIAGEFKRLSRNLFRTKFGAHVPCGLWVDLTGGVPALVTLAQDRSYSEKDGTTYILGKSARSWPGSHPVLNL